MDHIAYIEAQEHADMLAARLLSVRHVGRAQGRRWCRTFTRHLGLHDGMSHKLYAALRRAGSGRYAIHYSEVSAVADAVNKALEREAVAARPDFYNSYTGVEEFTLVSA